MNKYIVIIVQHVLLWGGEHQIDLTTLLVYVCLSFNSYICKSLYILVTNFQKNIQTFAVKLKITISTSHDR